MSTSSVWTGAIALAVSGGLALVAAATQGGHVRRAEDDFRAAAVTKPMPRYPASALRAKKSGVAIASVVTDTTGRVATVDILDAPDASIAAAVREAVTKWTFKPVQVQDRSGGRSMQGKLVFYFRIEGGKGSVVNPDDMLENREIVARREAARKARAARAAAPGTGAQPPPAPRVVAGGHGPEFEEIGDAQLRELESSGKLTFLDVRERDLFKAGHRPGSINILVDELNSRARVELPLDRTVVVDCSEGSARWCHVAGAFLRELGFTRVVIYIP